MNLILDGRAIAARIRENVKECVAHMTTAPGLAVILVGDDPASHLYVSLKQRACEAAGIRFELFLYPAGEPEESILATIDKLNSRGDVTGILVQLPLPTQNANRVIARIHPNKDVDGFHKENLRALADDRPGIVSALALGIVTLVDEGFIATSVASRQDGTSGRAGSASGGKVPGKKAAIVGSTLFAEPLRHLLAERNIVADRVDPNDADLAGKTKDADVLIVAVGRPGLITDKHVKPGAIVIDVGTTKVDDKVVGDVDAESVGPVAGARSPVPGGVGPMTVAMLLTNILKAHELQHEKKTSS